ncbi:MAG TPA: L,D-transpeptidase [Nitrospira sp.]|jgi:L,D-transpeptidase YbiS|nr:L,D-transpeptidase [Nitrospira sp.]
MARMLLGIALTASALLVVTVPQSSQLHASIAPVLEDAPEDPALLPGLQDRYTHLSRKLSQLAPRQAYILVDTARNHLYVKRNGQILLDAIASTGSGTILDKPGESQDQWIFDTPRGEFVVQSKLTNPVWMKPDWAFIEEGLAVPRNPADRVEPGVLGEYALGFGKGYFIHGTLYPRLLGKSVTHGCIRLNDDDLKRVYQLARVGTPILIF